MNVIFLDVDGVIDSKRKRNHLESAKLELLVDAAQQTQSRIVISSHWRLVQPQHRQLQAVLRYLGLEVIGSTPVRRPWEPERPLEIVEWLTAYNEHARELQRPAVTNFVAVDDRNLLSERGGAQLRGHFVRTDVNIGLTATSVERIVEIFGAGVGEPREGVAPVPSLAEALAGETAEHSDVPRGSFGEIRLDLSSPPSTDSRQYKCTLVADSNGCGDGSGPRPSPWIVTGGRENDVGGGTGSPRRLLPSAAELTVRVGARLARVSARLGGHSVRGGSVFFGGGAPRTATKDKSAPRGEPPTPPRAPHTVHGGNVYGGASS